MQSPRVNASRVGLAAFAVGLGVACVNGAAVAGASPDSADSGAVSSSGNGPGASAKPKAAMKGASSPIVRGGTASSTSRRDAIESDSFAVVPSVTRPAAAIAPAEVKLPDLEVSSVRIAAAVKNAQAASSTLALQEVNSVVQTADDAWEIAEAKAQLKIAYWSPADDAYHAPENPIDLFVSGVAEFVRRTFFNQGPIVDPRQYGELPDGKVLGTLGATDPDQDTLEYSVTQGPSYGTVTLTDSGGYTYTPNAEFAAAGGEDTFTVAVRDEGFHINLLDWFQPAATKATVTIKLNPVEAAPVTDPPTYTTQGFTIWNYTSKDLTYQSMTPVGRTYGSDILGPAFGTVLHPGDAIHWETITYLTSWSQGFATFTDSAGDTWWTGIFNASGTDVGMTCNSTAGACSVASPSDIVWDTRQGLVLDKPGSVIILPDGSPGQQATIVQEICHDGGAASCSFSPTRQVTVYTDLHNVGSIVSNNTNLTQNYSVEITDEQSQSDSLEISAEERFEGLFGVFDAALTQTYGHTWEQSHTFTQTFSLDIAPGDSVQIVAQQPLYRVYGDMTLTMGNSTWTLQNVYLDTPAPDLPSRYTYENVDVEAILDQSPPGTSLQILSVTPVLA